MVLLPTIWLAWSLTTGGEQALLYTTMELKSRVCCILELPLISGEEMAGFGFQDVKFTVGWSWFTNRNKRLIINNNLEFLIFRQLQKMLD